MASNKILLGLVVVASLWGGALTAQNRPNVLMICVDDLNDWVGFLDGNPDTLTPNLDRLAAAGRNFTNAHCVVTVCSPSRISVISGVGPTTHGSYQLGPAYQNIPALNEVPTMHRWFKDNGYRTMTAGKVLHHGFTGRLSADVDLDLDKRIGVSYKGSPSPRRVMSFRKGPWDWGAFPEKDEQTFDFRRAQAASQELRQTHDAPFFLSVGIFRPHVPLYVPQKWFDLIDPNTIKMPMDDPSDMADVPKHFQRKLGVAPTLPQLKGMKKWRSLVHAYLASIAFADHCVGEILTGLREGPNADNTVVVLWSDHGFHLGEKQHIAKRTLWEESTRVPFIIAAPGVKPGDCAESVSLLDLYPTLLELCKLPVNKRNEGVSLSPQLADPDSPRTRPAVSSSFFGNHAIRTKNWRYVRYHDGAEELYDHRQDPHELTNLADKPEQAAQKKRLAVWIPQSAAPEVMQAVRKRRGAK
jgi:arylsulfatase A-like enzyme